MTTKKSIPVCSSNTPKVKRCKPDCPSIPTVDIAKPIHIDKKPFSILPLDIETVIESAATINRKYSAGPNLIANPATGSAINVINTAAMVPPINEAIAEIASAASARPFIAMG